MITFSALEKLPERVAPGPVKATDLLDFLEDLLHRLHLLAQVIEQVARRERVEVVLALEQLGRLVDGPAREGTDRLAQRARAAGSADEVRAL